MTLLSLGLYTKKDVEFDIFFCMLISLIAKCCPNHRHPALCQAVVRFCYCLFLCLQQSSSPM